MKFRIGDAFGLAIALNSISEGLPFLSPIQYRTRHNESQERWHVSIIDSRGIQDTTAPLLRSFTNSMLPPSPRASDWRRQAIVDDAVRSSMDTRNKSNFAMKLFDVESSHLLFPPNKNNNDFGAMTTNKFPIIPTVSIIGKSSEQMGSVKRDRIHTQTPVNNSLILRPGRNRNPSGMILRSSPIDMNVEEDENSEKDDQNNNISNNEIKDSWMSKRLKDKLLGRIWRRKEEQGLGGASQLDSTEEPTPRGDAAISPIYMQYNGDEKEETGHVEKKELPSWLREKQKEMERLRQMEREGRAKQQQESAPLSSLQDATTSQDDGTSSSSAGSRAAQPSDLDQPRSTKPLSTTAKFNDLMKGMPTLQDMFGDGPGFDNSGSSNSNNDNSPAVSSWQPEPPTQDELKFC